MRIAVTGGAGFIGSHVCAVLGQEGHTFEIFDRKQGVELQEGGFSLFNFDAVIHLAAYADISRNWVSRHEREALYRDNVDALIATLETSPPDQPFVFVSSAAVGNSDSPYAVTKLFGEELTMSYKPRAGRVIRLVSCVGEGYSHGHIKDFVEKAKRGEAIVPRDNGYNPKSFVHVLDAAEAIVSLAVNEWHKRRSTIAAGSWGWRDTLAMMGLRAERWEEKNEGWRGDPVGLHVDSDWRCKRSVGEGVREALHSLGWDS